MRALVLSLVAALGLTATAVRADQATLQADIELLKSSVEALSAANGDLQRRLAELSRELRDAREEASKAPTKTALDDLKDQIRVLSTKLEEVDRKRVSDFEVVREQLEKIAKLVAAGPSSPASPGGGPRAETRPPAGNTTTPAIPSKGYEETIKPGDTVSGILELYNAEFRKQGLKTVSLKQVLDANPGLNPQRLIVGRKIFIPAPE